MNKIKCLLVIAFSVVLWGCGGHKYEGTWVAEVSIMGIGAKETLVIGSDFIETTDGKFNADIEVREFNGKRYLDFTMEDGEKGSFVIKNENTLTQEIGVMNIDFIRQK